MADVKNFGLKGVNADLQMGKGGGRLLWDGSKYLMTTDDGSTLAELRVAAPTSDNSSASKAYVDSVASGLDPKESVQLATTADLAAESYLTGTLTNFGTDADGIALVVADRLLVKDQSDAKQNGIFAISNVGTQAVPGAVTASGGVTAIALGTAGSGYLTAPTVTITGDGTGATATAVMSGGAVASYTVDTAGSGYSSATATVSGPTVASRSEDHDGTPTNEISAGNFTFVEGGTASADAGFVLQGSGTLTLDTDDLVWVQFSGAGQITGGAGILKTGNTLDLDFSATGGLSAGTGTATADLIAFSDNNSDVMRARSWADVLTDLDIANGSGNGIVTRTSAGNFTGRTISVTAAGAAGSGLTIANGDGVSGNPTLGLDILGQSSATVALGDTFIFNDVSDGFVKRDTVQGIVDLVVSATSDNEISQLNSSIVITDAGTGDITFTVDGDVVLDMQTGVADFNDSAVSGSGTLSMGAITGTSLKSTTNVIDQGVWFSTSDGTLDTDALFLFDDAAFTNTGKLTVGNLTVAANGIDITSGDIDMTSGDINVLSGNAVVSGDVQGATLTATALGVTQDAGIVFNSAGELAVDAGFSYNSATNEMTIIGIIASGDVQGATLTGVNLGNTGVVFSASGELTTDVTNFSFNNGTETLDATNITGSTIDMSGAISSDADVSGLTLTGDGLTAGRVAFVGSSKEIVDDAAFTYTTTDDVLTLGDSTTGGFTFTGGGAGPQTITGLKTNTDIIIVPNGTGEVVIGTSGAATLSSEAAASMTVEGQTDLFLQSGSGSVFIQDLSTTTAVTTAQFIGAVSDDEYFVFSSGANFPTLATANDTDIVIDLGNSVTNVIGVSDADAANYETSIAAAGDGALVTKGYVASQISSGASEESTKTTTALLDLTSTGTTAFSASLPADATVLSCVLKSTTLSDNAGTLVSVGYTGQVSQWMATADNDVSLGGDPGMLYEVGNMLFDSTTRAPIATISGVASTGAAAASIVLMYRVPLAASEPVL